MDEYKLGCRAYNRGNLSFAREMRKNPTLAEQSMREYVLKYKPYGYKFTRQKPLGPFIADFYCSKLSLVIEIDGAIHNYTKEYDRERELYFINQGISIARYKNEQVIDNPDLVYKDLMNLIQELKT